MDIYTTTFTYPRVSSTPHMPPPSLASHSDPYSFAHNPNLTNALDSRLPASQSGAADAESVQKLALSVSHRHGCIVTPSKSASSKGWNFHISGTYQQVVLARGNILRDCPSQHRSSIKLTRSEILDLPSTSPQVKPEVRARLDEIAEQTHTHIAVVNSPQSQTLSLAPPDRITADNAWSGLETERTCELTISGSSAGSVDIAKVRLLVMLDELSGLTADVCEIDHKLHAVIAGRRRAVIQSIQEETCTNIYFPSPLQGLVGPENGNGAISNGTSSPRSSNNTIWITGEFFGVQRAKDMMIKLSMNQSKAVMSRDVAILPRKVDWMLTDRAEDLRAIMTDNATFINFPPIGSSTSLITVYGEGKVNIQRTIRSVMQLACQFYVASLWLLPTQFNVLLPQSTLNPAQLSHVLKDISDLSGAEIVYKTMCFEMHGLEHEVRNAVAMVLELDAVKNFHHEIRFQIELANEHREFISGKKNGKINKIMQTTNVKIKFETFNDHNFLIDIAGNDANALHGLALLQEELPAEISFHVPEAYHKRIIGVGGKSIQRIMKKYGVYVKFSNAEEFAALGGYLDNEDNVVARTPAKNAINLDNLKQSVMELVNPKDKDFMTEKVAIPRKYHRTLLGEKSIFIHDIEAKTNCKFRFPDKESASEMISIFGPESQVHIASTMLLDHVPFEAEMIIPPHADISRVCNSADFLAFTESIKRDFEVSIVPTVRKPASEAPAALVKGECSFRFMCQRSNSDYLVTARELLEQFLMSQNVPVYPPSKTHKRADSFAESLPHFDSKLLSAAAHSDVSVEKRLRMANSSPDVKALFNNPQSTYLYNIEQADEASDNQSVYDSPSNDYWTPLPNIGGQTPVARARHADEPFKRGSDSLLESKIKEKLNKPRSMQNRAQSLDLTFSLSRITEASHYPPESPTTSTADEGNSSPTSATAPSFPSVYGPPPTVPTASPWGNTNTGLSSLHAHGRSARIMGDEGAEEVSRAISNLSMNDKWSDS